MLHDGLGKLTKNKHILVPLWIKRQANKSDTKDWSALENVRARLEAWEELWRFVLAYESAVLCQIIVFVVIEQNNVCRLNQNFKIFRNSTSMEYSRDDISSVNLSIFLAESKQRYQILSIGLKHGITKFKRKVYGFQPLWSMFTQECSNDWRFIITWMVLYDCEIMI